MPKNEIMLLEPHLRNMLAVHNNTLPSHEFRKLRQQYPCINFRVGFSYGTIIPSNPNLSRTYVVVNIF